MVSAVGNHTDAGKAVTSAINKAWGWLTSPVVIDLDGDGIELIDLPDSSAFFDIDADGHAEHTAWVAANDGILVIDLDGDGTVNHADELIFTRHAPNTSNDLSAFAAAFDSNGDGVFDLSDDKFIDSRIWRDLDQDGETDAGELFSLTDLGIASIDLVGTDGPGPIDGGNVIDVETTATLTDGGVFSAASVSWMVGPNDFTRLGPEGGLIRYETPEGAIIAVAETSSPVSVDLGSAGYGQVIGRAGDDYLYNPVGAGVLSGGGGNDTLVGGDGVDILIGGDGADTLQGGAGDDVLFGNAEDAVIDGGTGYDALFIDTDTGITLDLDAASVEQVVGGDGGDVFTSTASDSLAVDGGGGDDTITTGDGDDLLTGGSGNDTISAGGGSDVVTFAGKRSDYQVTTDGLGVTTVIDLEATADGDDGTDVLTGVERIWFSDSTVHLAGENNPVFAKDDSFSTGFGETLRISPGGVTTNDDDYDGDVMDVVAVGRVQSGTATLDKDGNILFTPEEGFSGEASFEYTVDDGHGSQSTASVTVTVGKPLPNDPYFQFQWGLEGANVFRVWEDYTGTGVTVGILDQGVDHFHPDLAANYDTSIDWDYRDGDGDAAADPDNPDENHGTFLGGIIAGARNGEGVVGVAYGATITGQRVLLTSGEDGIHQSAIDALQGSTSVDVSNLSWSSGNFWTYNDSLNADNAMLAAMDHSVTNGRGGLGTVFVASAGNERDDFGDSNYERNNGTRFTVAVGAVSSDGDAAYFSSPGANLLVTAPGMDIVSTDRLGDLGYDDTSGNLGGDYRSGQGTSYSAPIVSGVVALMLEANANLGYRDVQKILACSATLTDPSDEGWASNGAATWNGGGLHYSHDYGFGMVNALGAVRLAETWQDQETRANEQSVSASAAPGLAIPDGGSVTTSMEISQAIDLEHVDVVLDIDHTRIGDLTVTLISPEGTESVLVHRPEKDPDDPESLGQEADGIRFTFGTTNAFGESGVGTWQLKVEDSESGEVGILNSWTLNLYGGVADGNDTYVYTDTYTVFTGEGESERRTLSDSGGHDAINVSMVTEDSYIDLSGEIGSLVAGNTLNIAAGTVIEDAFAGDGDDVLLGNDADNRLWGGRGDDVLKGGIGADTLEGGAGRDTAVYVGSVAGVAVDLEAGTSSGGDAEGDVLSGIEGVTGSDQGDQLSGSAGENQLVGGAGDDVLDGRGGDDNLVGGDGADTLSGGAGDDVLFGGAGDDVFDGGAGNDIATYIGMQADYTVTVNAESVTVAGGEGTDILQGVELLRFSDGDLWVAGDNTAAVIGADTYNVDEDTSVAISLATLLANDSDADGDALEIVSVGNPVGGTVELKASEVVFTPDADFSGMANFDYTIDDGKGGVVTATVNVPVAAVNDAPVGSESLVVVAQEGEASGVLTATDIDSDAAGFNYGLDTGPDHGTVTVNADGTYTYTPEAGYSGEDSFIFSVADDGGAVGSGLVSVQVRGTSRYGTIFQVNTTSRNPLGSDDWTLRPDITTLANGDIVVAWASKTTDGDGYETLAQRFDQGGNPIGEEFQLNDYTFGDQDMVSLAALPDGGFVAAWASWFQDGSKYGIVTKRYDAAGEVVAGEGIVNEETHSNQRRPNVVAMSDGGYVVVWESWKQDGDGYGVFGRKIDADGRPIGEEFHVNTYTESWQHVASVTPLEDGCFVAVWQSGAQDGDAYGVFGQLYDSTGTPSGSEFQVHEFIEYAQMDAETATLTNGRFVVVWKDGDNSPSPGAYFDIAGRVYESDGTPVAGEFRVNIADYAGEQFNPSITAMTDGGFLITWESQADNMIRGQRFDGSGNLSGGLIDIAPFTTSEEHMPRISAMPDGGFAVAWQDGQTNGGDAQVYASVFGGSNDPMVATISVTGREGRDALFGGVGNDTLVGGMGDDRISGGGGDDILDGGEGTDTAVFSGSLSDYAFSLEGGAFVISHASEGSDTITNMEYAEFADTVLDLGSGFLPPEMADANILIPQDYSLVEGRMRATDPDGDDAALTYALEQGSSNGTVTVNADGAYSFTPSQGFYGEDSFTIRAIDEAGISALATISVNVVPQHRFNLDFQVSSTPLETPVPGDRGMDWSRQPEIAALPDGGFVAAWTAEADVSSSQDIYLQRFDSTGNPVGAEVRVNSFTSSNQAWPSITALSDGGYFVTWASDDQAGSTYTIFAKRFNVKGNPVGDDTLISEVHGSWEIHPRVTELSDGNLAVTWIANGLDGDGRGIFMRCINADDVTLGPVTQVNTYTASEQENPDIAALADGGFVISWDSYNQNADGGKGVSVR